MTFTLLFHCIVNQLLIHLISFVAEMWCFLIFFRKRHVRNNVVITSLHREYLTECVKVRSPSWPIRLLFAERFTKNVQKTMKDIQKNKWNSFSQLAWPTSIFVHWIPSCANAGITGSYQHVRLRRTYTDQSMTSLAARRSSTSWTAVLLSHSFVGDFVDRRLFRFGENKNERRHLGAAWRSVSRARSMAF